MSNTYYSSTNRMDRKIPCHPPGLSQLLDVGSENLYVSLADLIPCCRLMKSALM